MSDREPEFLDSLRVTVLEEPWVRLDDRFRYYSAIPEEIITVPFGFVTDCASVPPIPVVYARYGGEADYAGVLHDYLYRMGMYDRKTCDRIFREAMKVRGYWWGRRQAMYLGVRVGGDLAYYQGEGPLDPR